MRDPWLQCLLSVGALGLGALGLVAGCTELPPCPDDTPTVVSIPSGVFAPADTYPVRTVTGTPFFSGTFPRGAVGPEEVPEASGGAGNVEPDTTPSHGDINGSAPEPVPSARIEVDRQARIVTRSYVDDQGRTISERWRFKGAP